MKQFARLTTRALAVSILIFAVGSQVAAAHDSNDRQGITAENQDKAERQLAEKEAAIQRRAAKQQLRLGEAKLKACQNRQRNIRQHIINIERHATRQMEVFARISQKVQDFADRKNLTVENKATLLGDISSAESKVKEDLAALKADAAGFACDGDNPKGALTAVKADAKLIRSDLKAYRTTVRHLIQAVRQANGQQNDSKDQESDGDSSSEDTEPSQDNNGGAE